MEDRGGVIRQRARLKCGAIGGREADAVTRDERARWQPGSSPSGKCVESGRSIESCQHQDRIWRLDMEIGSRRGRRCDDLARDWRVQGSERQASFRPPQRWPIICSSRAGAPRTAKPRPGPIINSPAANNDRAPLLSKRYLGCRGYLCNRHLTVGFARPDPSFLVSVTSSWRSNSSRHQRTTISPGGSGCMTNQNPLLGCVPGRESEHFVRCADLGFFHPTNDGSNLSFLTGMPYSRVLPVNFQETNKVPRVRGIFVLEGSVPLLPRILDIPARGGG